MKSIKFKHVNKQYDDNLVIEDLNLEVKPGERLVLLGPSGCGKSTILRMIAGLEAVNSGKIFFDDEDVTDLKAGLRNVSMVFQDYALYPHMTVKENIIYALKANKVDDELIEKRLNGAVNILKLSEYLDRKPSELSGGQRQRVALARALVKKSDIFLLDEPLSNLDNQLRASARKNLLELHEYYQQTLVYVTHDQTEAMTFGERIALMNKGEILQIAEPDEIYENPKNIFVAEFIGNPPMNVFKASTYEQGKFYLAEESFAVSSNLQTKLSSYKEAKLIFGIRPEDIKVSAQEAKNSIKAKIKYYENYGAMYALFLDIEGFEAVAMVEKADYKKNSTVYLTFPEAKLSFFDKSNGLNIKYLD